MPIVPLVFSLTTAAGVPRDRIRLSATASGQSLNLTLNTCRALCPRRVSRTVIRLFGLLGNTRFRSKKKGHIIFVNPRSAWFKSNCKVFVELMCDTPKCYFRCQVLIDRSMCRTFSHPFWASCLWCGVGVETFSCFLPYKVASFTQLCGSLYLFWFVNLSSTVMSKFWMVKCTRQMNG